MLQLEKRKLHITGEKEVKSIWIKRCGYWARTIVNHCHCDSWIPAVHHLEMVAIFLRHEYRNNLRHIYVCIREFEIGVVLWLKTFRFIHEKQKIFTFFHIGTIRKYEIIRDFFLFICASNMCWLSSRQKQRKKERELDWKRWRIFYWSGIYLQFFSRAWTASQAHSRYFWSCVILLPKYKIELRI